MGLQEGAEKGARGQRLVECAHRRERNGFFIFFFLLSLAKKKKTLDTKSRSRRALPCLFLLFLGGENPKKRGGEALPSLLLSSLSLSLSLSLCLSLCLSPPLSPSLPLSPSGVGHLVAEKLKLALLLCPRLSSLLLLLLLQAAKGEDAPGPQPPPLPSRQRLPVDENHGLGAYVRDEERRAGPHPLRALRSPDLLELLLLPRRGGLLLLLDRELHAPDPEEARERDVVGGSPGVGDGDKVLGAERGCVRGVGCFCWFFNWRRRGGEKRGSMRARSTKKNGETRKKLYSERASVKKEKKKKINGCAIDRMLQRQNPPLFPSNPTSHQLRLSLPLRSGRGKRRCGDAEPRRRERRRDKRGTTNSPLRSTTVGSSQRVPFLCRLQNTEAETRTGPLEREGRWVRVTHGLRAVRRAKVIFFCCFCFLFFYRFFEKVIPHTEKVFKSFLFSFAFKKASARAEPSRRSRWRISRGTPLPRRKKREP